MFWESLACLASTRHLQQVMQMLRVIAEMLFERFHPVTQAVETKGGRKQIMCPPRDVMKKIAHMVVHEMGAGMILASEICLYVIMLIAFVCVSVIL